MSAFVSTVTTAANARRREEMHNTITGHDVLIAFNNLGFYHRATFYPSKQLS